MRLIFCTIFTANLPRPAWDVRVERVKIQIINTFASITNFTISDLRDRTQLLSIIFIDRPPRHVPTQFAQCLINKWMTISPHEIFNLSLSTRSARHFRKRQTVNIALNFKLERRGRDTRRCGREFAFDYLMPRKANRRGNRRGRGIRERDGNRRRRAFPTERVYNYTSARPAWRIIE